MKKIDCYECDGTGCFMEQGCCGNALRDGSCCGNGIPVQVECKHCNGTGYIEVIEDYNDKRNDDFDYPKDEPIGNGDTIY